MTILNELYDQLTNLERWLSHFMFTKTILCMPIYGGTQHATSFTTQIIDRYIQWLHPRDQAAQWAGLAIGIVENHLTSPTSACA
jgi:hypothetical protein